MRPAPLGVWMIRSRKRSRMSALLGRRDRIDRLCYELLVRNLDGESRRHRDWLLVRAPNTWPGPADVEMVSILHTNANRICIRMHSERTLARPPVSRRRHWDRSADVGDLHEGSSRFVARVAGLSDRSRRCAMRV